MRFIKGMLAIALALVLAACGSGGCDAGSSPLTGATTCGTTTTGGGTTTATAPTIALAISSSTVTIASPATVTAVVTDSAGPVSGAVVTFSSVAGSGAFTPSSGTALTNANGIAVISLSPVSPSANGADQIVASVSVNGQTVSASKGYQLAASNVTVAGFSTDVDGGSLGPYGQANVTATVTGAAGSPVSMTVTSACVSKGKATISPASATTTTGTANFTYKDNGCGATQITDDLQLAITGSPATATRAISLTSPAATSIGFVSASPATIYLKGSGLAESSEVKFIVKDTAGNALPNQSVSMELTTLTGGITIQGGSVPVTRLSDSSGQVSVLVNSGTVPTPVRVKATVGAYSTLSSNLTIGVGLPSQINFSFAQATINIEGFNYIDTPNTYTVIASDRSGNPVPDGTTMNFTTEGGQIQSSRFIALTNGIARADAAFVSALPHPDDGRVTVIAYALGEESFKDQNGNNVYDSGEPFQDLGNIYRDRNFDGVFQVADDEYVSLDLSGSGACVVSSDPILSLDRTIPTIAGTCDGAWGRAYVRRATETVLSTSSSDPVWPPGSPYVAFASSTLNLRNSPSTTLATYSRVAGSTITGAGLTGGFAILVRDSNSVRLNPVAAGSVIGVAATKGLTVLVTGGSPVPSTADATLAGISYEFDATTISGTITINVTSPKGLTTGIPVRIFK
jgi:hypothetical protein